MNIVFLVDKYLPVPSSNVTCMLNVATYLKNQGHSIYFIAEDYYTEHIYDNEGIYSDYVKIGEDESYSIPQRILRIIKNDNYYNKETVNNYIEKIKEIHYNNPIDILVCVQHPRDSLRVGIIIKKEMPNIKTLAYFLDPIEGILLEKNIHSIVKNFNSKRLYKEVINNYDKVILPEYWQGQYAKKFKLKGNNIKFVGLPNLREDVKSNFTNYNDEIKIVFAGAFYDDIRGIDVLEVFKKVFDKNKSIKLYLYSTGLENEIENIRKKYPNNLFTSGYVSREELDKILSSSDFLLNVSNKITSCVPGKLFEYFSYAKPIINYQYIEDDPSKDYIEKYPLSYTIKNGRNDDVNKLLSFIEENKNKTIDYNSIKTKFKRNLAQYSADIILEE